MSRRHRGSATSARRHLAKAIGSAALGPLSQPSSKCRFNRKTTSRIRAPFWTGFSGAPQPLPTRSKARGTKMPRGVDWKLVRAGPEITNSETGDVAADHYHRHGTGRSAYQSFRAKTYRLSRVVTSMKPERRSARPRKTRPPNSCHFGRMVTDHREDARSSVCKGPAAAMGDARSYWESVGLTHEAKM